MGSRQPVRLPVGLGDVHRRNGRHHGQARSVEIECGPGRHLQVLHGQMRRQRRGAPPGTAWPATSRNRHGPTGAGRAAGRSGSVPAPRSAAARAANPCRTSRRSPHRRAASAAREPRILRGGPPHVAAGPADTADQLDIPTELLGNDVGPDPRIVGGKSTGRAVVGQRVAEDQQAALRQASDSEDIVGHRRRGVPHVQAPH